MSKMCFAREANFILSRGRGFGFETFLEAAYKTLGGESRREFAIISTTSEGALELL